MNIELETTNACNLRCIHCIAEAGEPRKNEFSIDEVKGILGEAKRLRFDSVVVTGGEPLLRKDIFEIICEIKSQGFEIIFNTNTLLITDEVLRKLKNLGVAKIRTSIYGARPETHEKITCLRGSYKRLINNLVKIRDTGFDLSVAVVVNKDNLSELKELSCLSKRLRIQFNFSRIILGGRAKGRKDLGLNPNEYQIYIKEINSLKEKNEKLGMGYLKNTETFSFLLNRDSYKECMGGKSNIGIRSDLKVTPCLALTPLTVGDLRKQSLGEVLESREVNKIKQFSGSADEKCAGCSHLEKCKSGCRAHAFYTSGNIDSRDPGCWL